MSEALKGRKSWIVRPRTAKLMIMVALSAKAVLEGNALFRQLPAATIDKIVALSTTRSFPKEALIFSQGDAGDAFYGIVSGVVRISAISADGDEIYLRDFKPGDTFGEIALLDGQSRTANATTKLPSELIIIQRNQFLSLLEQEPKLAIHLLQLISERLRWTSALVEDAAFLDVPARLAKRLLSLAKQQGETIDRGIELKMSQDDLAHFLSVSRQIVNQHLQSWRIAGWIDLGRGRVIILDVDAIEDVASDEV